LPQNASANDAGLDQMLWSLAAWNTLVLLTSGHVAALAQEFMRIGCLLLATVMLSLLLAQAHGFVWVQAVEYAQDALTMSRGVYGTGFSSLTGLHGSHVLMGATLLAAFLMRHRAASYACAVNGFAGTV